MKKNLVFIFIIGMSVILYGCGYTTGLVFSGGEPLLHVDNFVKFFLRLVQKVIGTNHLFGLLCATNVDVI